MADAPIDVPVLDDAGREMKRFVGFLDEMGARIAEWGPDRCVIHLAISDMHRNGISVVHGGVYASLIDTAGAHAGIFCAVPGNTRKAMTISLNVNLVGSATEGTLVTTARVRKAGKTIFVASCDVHDTDGNLLATGEVVGRYGRGSHLPEGVPADA
tara:strand:+ start:841 stop:1308 length:468 start_codon:yes stop_codon:yes gene_type:complete